MQPQKGIAPAMYDTQAANDAQLLTKSGAAGCGLRSVMSELFLPQDVNGACPFSLIEFFVEPGGASTPHAHPSAEIWYIRHGRGLVLTQRGGIEVEAGDVVYLRPGAIHHIENRGDERLAALSVAWTS